MEHKNSPMKTICDPKFKQASSNGVSLERDIRMFAENHIYHAPKKCDLEPCLKDCIKFAKNKNLINDDDEKKLRNAVYVYHKIKHTDFTGAKKLLEKAGINVETVPMVQGIIPENASEDELVSLMLKMKEKSNDPSKEIDGVEFSDLNDPNANTYGKMWDSSVPNGVFEKASNLFEEASQIFDKMIDELNSQ